MTVVVDASVVVSALVDSGTTGSWAEQQLRERPLSSPHLMPCEVANVLRRAQIAGQITPDVAELAHADLLDLDVLLYPYEPLAERAWSLRETVSTYDAWYVALAETLNSDMVTLDGRLAGAPGPMCTFITPY
ncbi:MAG: type II toxin-antitoxin system VapC family toxin [Acidimicrobiia bacterium]